MLENTETCKHTCPSPVSAHRRNHNNSHYRNPNAHRTCSNSVTWTVTFRKHGPISLDALLWKKHTRSLRKCLPYRLSGQRHICRWRHVHARHRRGERGGVPPAALHHGEKKVCEITRLFRSI